MDRMTSKRRYLVICDAISESFFSSLFIDTAEVHLVMSDEVMEKLGADEISVFDGAIISAELSWPGHSPDDYYGFDLAVSLRLRYRFLSPLCILSFMPKDYFFSLPEIKYNILKARGTIYQQIPFEVSALEKSFSEIWPLSQASLVYLSNLLVDIKHIIDHLRHILRLTTSQERLAQSLRKLDILSSSSIYPKSCELSSLVLSAHQDGNDGLFYRSIDELLDLLGAYLQQSIGSQIIDDVPHYTVVIVDDNLDDLAWATSALQCYFVVIPFQHAMEAKAYIDNDSGNEIAAIVCDWQLLKPESGEHQEMLGFELLEYAARKGHYALFSLTSTDDTSTLEVDQYLWFEHTLITKDFHHDDALWKMYIPIIRQKIEHTRAIIASLPTGESWTSDFKLAYRKELGKSIAYKQYYTSLKDQYITSRNSGGWHSFEAEVSYNSSRLWKYYSKAMDADERPFIFDLKTQWGIELNHEIKNVLIIRRLFLAFWFNKTQLDISFRVPEKGVVEDPILNIYSVLRHRYFHEVMEEREGSDAQKVYKDLNNAAKVFANQLAIEPNRLPQGVLPEEKAWLVSIGVKPDHGNDNLYYPE